MFCRIFPPRLDRFPDPRDPDRIVYPKQALIWSAMLMFLMGLGSRRQFRFESGTPTFVRNLNILAGSRVETAPHDDTLMYYLEKVAPAHCEGLPPEIVRRLVRMKALDQSRVHGAFTVVIDGTGMLFFRTLRDLSPKNRTEHREGPVRQRFAWVNDLDYEGRSLSAFECQETASDGEHYFAWITDIPVGCASVVTLANQGGRRRWKIENEGFNIQKNGGYELEHAYSQNENAGKSLYFLLQVAHALNQLRIKGGLLGDFFKTFGSIRNYLRRLAESLRQVLIDPAGDEPQTLPPGPDTS